MFIPPYGPRWRFKLTKYAPMLYHIIAHHYEPFKKIRVAPYNKRRNPKKLKPKH